jgi:hypothetical protein
VLDDLNQQLEKSRLLAVRSQSGYGNGPSLAFCIFDDRLGAGGVLHETVGAFTCCYFGQLVLGRYPHQYKGVRWHNLLRSRSMVSLCVVYALLGLGTQHIVPQLLVCCLAVYLPLLQYYTIAGVQELGQIVLSCLQGVC